MNFRDTLYQEQDNTSSHSIRNSMLTGVGSYAGFKASKFITQRVRIPGTHVGNLRFVKPFTINDRVWYESIGLHSESHASIYELIWNAVKATEEQFGKIPRAFSASTLLGKDIFSRSEFEITESIFEKHKKALYKYSQGAINENTFRQGLVYRNGKIFTRDSNEFLAKMNIMPGRWASDVYKEGHNIGYMSRFTKAYNKINGLPNLDSDFVFSASGWRNRLQSANAVFTVGMENYTRLLDNPLEFISHFLEKDITKSGESIIDKLHLTGLYEATKNKFGIGGEIFAEGLTGMQILKRHALRGLPRFAMIYGGYKLLKGILRSNPLTKNTVISQGIEGVAAKVYQDTSRAYAAVSDITGLTELSKAQKEKSPGSTSILGNLAYSLSGMIAGGTVGGALNLIQKTPLDTVPEAPQVYRKIVSSLEGRFESISKLKLGELGRTGAFAAIGAGIGLIATLPNWLGSIGSSKSKKELDDIYSGERLVARKRGRFWSMGQAPWEGSDISHFAPHWTVATLTDAEEKGRLPEKYYKHPISMWIDKALDPYAVERKLDKERPYKYWGPSDHGMGIVEKAFSFIKEAIKPTVEAHPEGEKLESTTKYSPPGIHLSKYKKETEKPISLSGYATDLKNSLKEASGIQGFVVSALSNSALDLSDNVDIERKYATSGQILSAQRRYWDKDYGGLMGLTEPYRRMNNHPEYNVDTVTSDIRNKMPDWLPDRFKTGDPYVKIKQGELRLPGRGFEAMHKELRGLDPNDYPSIYKMKILHDVAPKSLEYLQYKNIVESQISKGNVGDRTISMYKEMMRQDEELKNQYKFDEGKGIFGKYNLMLKKIGRALPTESLYPISPIHKFTGPADIKTEYEEQILLDSYHKSWKHPIRDFVIPSINKAIYHTSLVPYIPHSASKQAKLESQFDQLQYIKNEYLRNRLKEEKYTSTPQEKALLRSGIKDTLYEHSPYDDYETIRRLLPSRYKKFIDAFESSKYNKQKIAAETIATPEIQQIVHAQSDKRRMLQNAEYSKLKQKKRQVPHISGLSKPLVMGKNAPDKDFLGYAPDVDLNAFKVKVVNNLGENIHKYDLWKRDQEKSQALDDIIDIGHSMNSGVLSKHSINKILYSAGMKNVRITSTPSLSGSDVDMQSESNNEKNIHDLMFEKGWVTY